MIVPNRRLRRRGFVTFLLRSNIKIFFSVFVILLMIHLELIIFRFRLHHIFVFISGDNNDLLCFRLLGGHMIHCFKCIRLGLSAFFYVGFELCKKLLEIMFFERLKLAAMRHVIFVSFIIVNYVHR